MAAAEILRREGISAGKIPKLEIPRGGIVAERSRATAEQQFVALAVEMLTLGGELAQRRRFLPQKAAAADVEARSDAFSASFRKSFPPRSGSLIGFSGYGATRRDEVVEEDAARGRGEG